MKKPNDPLGRVPVTVMMSGHVHDLDRRLTRHSAHSESLEGMHGGSCRLQRTITVQANSYSLVVAFARSDQSQKLLV